jgi:hypothetical protein
MYEFMADRLRDETKDMELRIETISDELKTLAKDHEEASLALHQATAQVGPHPPPAPPHLSFLLLLPLLLGRSDLESAPNAHARMHWLCPLLQKLRAVAVGHALNRHIETERASRRGKLAKLQATLAEQQHRMQSFDERELRRQTMSGTVAQSDLDEDGEDRLKQLFLVRKIYNNMLTRRLRDDQRRTDKLANAYQRIRTATGLDDVNAIVTKFRTRDATFASLQAQMKAARDRVDALLAERRALVWALDEARTTGA